jgi:hypothetical protein
MTQTQFSAITGAIVLFEYRYFVDRVANWDLAVIGVSFVVVKMALMAWYAVRD